jgi:glyoxylase-like metal-dependent hydrolase (beta-lactamase superfamily II)
MKEISNGVFIETAYDGVNVGAILTGEGVICIDVPSYPQDARDWVNRVGRLHGRGLRYLILTDCHGDRILNTRWMNVPIITQQMVSDRLGSYDKRYPQQLLDSLAQRNPSLGRDLTNSPVDHAAISFDGEVSLYAGQHDLSLTSNPGPTAGNIWITCPGAGILFTGDSVVSGFHPPLGEMCLREWLASLDSLMAGDYDARLIVPGRGEPCGLADVDALASYLRHIETVVSQYIVQHDDRQDLDTLVPEIASQFPAIAVAPDWINRQVRLGLQRAYDELLAASDLSLIEK